MKKVIILAPIICLILYSVFAFLTSVVPFAGFLCALLLVLTGVFSIFRNSKISLVIYNIVAVAVACIVNREFVFSAIYAISYIGAGFWLCYSILKGKEGAQAIIVTMICVIMADYGSVAISNIAYGLPPFAFVDEMFALLKPVVVETIEQNAAMFKIESPEQFFAFYEMSVRMILPSVIIIIELIKTIILTFFTKVIVNRLLKGTALDLKYSMFKSDGVTVFVFFLSAIISMFAGDGKIAVVFANIYAILNVVLALCGMSLIDWYLRDKRNVKIFFRFLILGALAVLSLIPVLSVLLVVVALIDARRNFRNIGVVTKG